jgi:putative ABC transport system permease protein
MRSHWWSEFPSKLRVALRGRRSIAEDLAEELASHLDLERRAALDRGLSPDQADAIARRRVGNPTYIAERVRDTWSFPSLESFLSDVRHGFRAMRRSPGFSLVVIGTLALGIGVNTAIFSVVHEVLLKPLPYPGAERLVKFGESAGKAQGISVSWGNFQNWREANHTFEAMAAYQFTERTLTGRGDPTVTLGLTVTAPYFSLLGMRPLMGRLFNSDDDRPGAAPVIVLSHRFWSRQLGGDPNIVGATLIFNGAPVEVAGVAAPLWEPWKVDYYLPLGRAAGAAVNRAQHGSIRALGRLKPGITLAAAHTDLDAIMRRLAEIDPGSENDHRSYGRFWAEDSAQPVRGTLWILMGAAALILLIASANVASLLLARNSSRSGELALRKAIGAGQLRLVRQLLTETTVIALIGGLAGVALAQAGLRLLIAFAPPDIPRLTQIALDLPVLLFASAITLAAGLAAGLAPVIFTGKLDLTGALKEGWRLSGGGRNRQAFRNLLVIGEVALTFVLTFGSGLLLRSLLAAQNASPGFQAQQLLSFELQLPSRAYRTPEAVAAFYTRVLDGLRAIPGVTAAGTVYGPPGGGDRGDWFYSISGRPAPPRSDVPVALFNIADAGYFPMMGIPLNGRDFNATDRAGGPKVAIVNQTFARLWWPGESPLGHRIKVGGPYREGPELEIVGVAGDVKQDGLDSQPLPELYQPFAQKPGERMAIMVRSAGDPALLMAAIRARVLTLDRNLPVQHLETMERSLGASLARRRFSTLLLTAFALLAMLLAAIGIYGLFSYWVAMRENEIAVRLALGARPSIILRWVGLRALRLAAAGIALGLIGAWVAARGLEDVVFGIAPRNPVTMLAAALAVAAIAIAATALPAWRAARIDAARRLHSA